MTIALKIAVPALIQSVKDAGLLLIALGPDDILTLLRQTLGSALSIDGYMSHRYVMYSDSRQLPSLTTQPE